MLTFLIILLAVFVALNYHKRISILEDRLNKFEQKIVSTTQTVAPLTSQVLKNELEEGRSVEFSQRELEKEKVISGLNIAPAPAPLPVFHNQISGIKEEKGNEETQEEKSARWLGRVGAIAVLVGVSFFLKYAFDNNWIGPMGRVVIGIIAGLATIGTGHWLRPRYLNYSDVLMGCGIGILYLALYASYGFYSFVEPTIALLLMSLVTVFAMVLAVSGKSLGLAVLATLGGFLTPIFIPVEGNNLVLLSIYMIILDLGVLGTAIYQKWTALNYLTFAGTVLLFLNWFERFYSETQIVTTFFFITIFFLIFLATSVLHHVLRNEKTRFGDFALLILNAMVYFGIVYELLSANNEDLLGFFALLLSFLYTAISYFAFVSNRTDRTLNLFLPGIAVVFLTLAIPLQLSGYYISLAWLIEAVVLVATGLYLKERPVQVFGWLVLLIGFLRLPHDILEARNTYQLGSDYGLTPFWNTGFFLMVFGAASLYVIAYLYHYFRDNEKEGAHIMLLALTLGSIGTALTLNLELNIEHRHWSSLPWLIEGGILLVLGLRLRSRITELLGWLVLGWGILLMFTHVDEIHSGRDLESEASLPTPFLNLGFLLMIFSVVSLYVFAYLYRTYKEMLPDWKKYAGALIIMANLLTIAGVSWEIDFYYSQQITVVRNEYGKTLEAESRYYGGAPSFRTTGYQYDPVDDVTGEKIAKLESSKETAITVFWAVYAILLLVIGFVKRIRNIRIFGLIFFFVTAGRVFIMVWNLGEFERIVSSIVFGVIALGASFLYVKYKERLREMIYEE